MLAETEAHPLLAAARGLAPLVDGVRDRFDRERQLPGELVTAIGAAGVFGMWLPRALGGPEVDPLTFLAVIEELARQDGSVGWCSVIAAAYGRLAGSLDEEVAREIFGTGRSIVAGSTNPTGRAVAVRGGYRVTGRWTYGSFIGHSRFVLAACVTHDGDGPRRGDDGVPDMRLCLFPREQVEVFDVWHVGGLRATGSNDYQVTELFVPEEWTVPLTGSSPVARQPGPLYAPMPSVLSSFIAIVALGIGRAAVEALMELAGTKASLGAKAALRDQGLAQVDTARAEALLGTGRAWLFAEMGKVWDDMLAGRAASLQRRAMVRLAAYQATRNAIEAVDLMYALAGGASLFEGNRLERCFRDVHAAGQHIAVSGGSTLEPVGRVLLGLEPGARI